MDRTSAARPALLLTADALLADDVGRLAAAAGVTLTRVVDPAAALPSWRAAAIVLVGADQVEGVALRLPPRRPEVHVVAVQGLPDAAYRSALRLGAQSVVELPGAGPWLLETLADLCEGSAQQGRSLAVVGASGGAGASVFAAALAAVASRRSDVLLLDLDPWGPGQRLLVGHDEETGIAWHDLTVSSGRLGARALRDAVPRRQRLGVLSWSREGPDRLPPPLIEETVTAGRRGHAWVVLDVPRRWDGDLRTCVAGCDHIVVLADARIGCLSAAARFIQALLVQVPEAGLVVRTHRDSPPTPDVARALGLELWAEMRDERRLDEHLALGLGPAHAARGPLARTAALVLERCAASPARAAA